MNAASKIKYRQWLFTEVHFYYIAFVAMCVVKKLYDKSNRISAISRPNFIIWINQSDRFLWIFVPTNTYPPSLFRKRKREQIGNGQFLFPDCLTKKGLKRSFQYFSERTLSTDSARSSICNTLQLKRC